MNRLLIMTCAMAALGVAATSAIAEDAYIESNGSQFINTGYYPSRKTKIEVDFQLVNAVSAKDCIFGNYGSTFSVLLYANPPNTYFQFCGKDGNWSALSTGVSIDTARHTMVIDIPKKKGTMSAPDGTVQGQANFNSGWTYNNTANWPITLFASCKNTTGTSAIQHVSAKIYGAKIWESEDNGATYSLLHNYVPAMKGGYAGFYDTETGDFLSNQPASSAGFAHGGDLLEIEDPYVQSDSTAFSVVDTGYFPNNKTKVEVDFQQTQLTKNRDCVFGHYGSDYTLLVYGPVNDSLSGAYYLVAKDGSYVDIGSNLSPSVAADCRRHTAVIDVPNRYVEMRAPDGGVQGKADLSGKSWTWNFNNVIYPLTLFGSSKDYGQVQQKVYAKIYSVKIWENETADGSGEWIEKHVFLPCINMGAVGFKDQITGKFISGNHLTIGGGTVPEESFDDDDTPYISTGTSGMAISFDTGYYVTANTCVVCDYMPLKQQNNQQFPFEAGDSISATNASEKSYMRMYGNGNTGQGDVSYACGKILFKTTNVPYWPHVRRKLTLDAYNGKVKVETHDKVIRDITLDSTCRNPNPSSTTLKILSNGSGNGAYCMAKLYSFQIYESGSLVHDYRPYVKNGVVGLRDVEGNGGFITASNAANSTKLKCGGNIEGRRDAYVENNGTTILDLGYRANMKTRIEYDFQNIGTATEKVFFGAWSTGSGNLKYCCWNSSGNIKFIFCGNGNGYQTTTSIKVDYGRHTTIMDMKERALKFITEGVTNNVTVNSGAVFNASDESSQNMGVFAALTGGMVSTSRIYAVRIYEDNELVHEFLPYKNGDIVSLRDTVTGHVATKATTSEPWPTISGKGVDGAEKWFVRPQNSKLTKKAGTITLSANASGAISYKWTKNGETATGGIDGNLTVEWAKGGATDTYTVTPVYDLYGIETEGEPVSCTVENLSPGMIISFR